MGNQRSKPLAVLCLVTLVVLVASPNLVLLAIDPDLVWFVRGVLITGALIAAVFAILRRKLWIVCLLLVPCAALAPAEIFYIVHFGRPSDANIIATVLESNLRETDDFLGDAKLYLAAAIAIFTLYGVAATAIVAPAAFRCRPRLHTGFWH